MSSRAGSAARSIDTSTARIYQMMGVFAEFERAMIRERVTRRVTIAPSFELDQEHGAPL